jgi:hypothetical protein
MAGVLTQILETVKKSLKKKHAPKISEILLPTLYLLKS